MKVKMFGRYLIVCLILIQLVRGTPTPSGNEAIDRHTELVRYAKAAEMRNYMNAAFDPCEDFYKFTCGNYYRINPPNEPPYQSGFLLTFIQSFNRKLSTLLKDDEATDTEIKKKAKHFYESCMNLPALKSTYREKLKEIISEFGQMPALAGDTWQDTDFDWVKIVAEIAHKYNQRIIVGYLNMVDATNNTANRMHIILQDIPMESTSIYTDDNLAHVRQRKNRARVERLKSFLGLDAKLAQETVNDIFEFESNLFAGVVSKGDNSEYFVQYDDEDEDDDDEDEDANDNDDDGSTQIGTLTTIKKMQNKYFPKLDIERLVNISMGSVPTGMVHNLIDDDAKNLAIVMNNTPKSIIADYIFFHLIDRFIQDVPKDNKELHNICVQKTKLHFAKILDNMVYRKYTTKQTERDVQYMFDTIKSAFHNVLQSDKLSWMREDTRQYALEKLKTIGMQIDSFEQTNFTEEFGPLTINNHDYVENLKSIFALNAIKSRQMLNEPPKPYDNPEKPTLSPVYVVTDNLIKIPVSVLQPYYLWSDAYPNALKFGTLGFLMSHELIHGFDEEGRLYDTRGNLNDWWDQASNEYFGHQAECFSAQYGNFRYEGHFLPKQDSQSENIADNGGIRLAYDAYLQWYEDAKRSHQKMDLESMPRLNYTSKQLFFISYGQFWCSSLHPDLRILKASTDGHSPAEFRVLGPLSNLEEFSKEFKCPVGSAMNPAKKCIIY